jgi:hypothetical protein
VSLHVDQAGVRFSDETQSANRGDVGVGDVVAEKIRPENGGQFLFQRRRPRRQLSGATSLCMARE